MKTHLCRGNKTIPKCIFADIKTKTYFKRGNFKFSYGETVTGLFIYCNKKQRGVEKYITSCKYYSNQTLEESLKK